MKLYEKEKQALLRLPPRRSRTAFLSWESMAECLEFDYEDSLEEFNISDQSLANLAFDINEQDSSYLDEEQLLEKENSILSKLKQHWSLSNIILKNFPISNLTEQLNKWSSSGEKNNKIFGAKPLAGYAIAYFINPGGISFTVYEPFMIPHTELYYSCFNNLPEWNFEDLSSEDIFETYLLLADYLKSPILVELEDWHDKFQVK